MKQTKNLVLDSWVEEEKGNILGKFWNIEAEEMISFSFGRFCFKMAGKDKK